MADSNGQLREDIEKLRKDLSQITKDMQSMAAERGQNAYRSALAASDEATEYARTQIGTRPLTSVLAAFGAGVLLGKLMNGRR